MCFILGQLIASGVLKGLANHTSEWAYRIPFAIQWVWPTFLIPLVYLAPESPWYLARMNRLEDAEKSLRRLQSSKATHIDPKKTLATIIHTDNFEKEHEVGSSYLDCFKGPELRRTEIACMVFTGQILCGINFAYNSSYFFEQVGIDTSTTYSLALGGTFLALFGCFLNWFSKSQQYPIYRHIFVFFHSIADMHLTPQLSCRTSAGGLFTSGVWEE